MVLIIADRVRESNVITGTGNVTLGGSVSGFRTFASVMTNTQTTWYTLVDNVANTWEVGVGTWNTGNTLSRNTVLASSNSGSLVSFAGNTCDCFIDLPAELCSGTLSFPAITTVTLTATGLITPAATIGVKGNASGSATQAGSIGEFLSVSSQGNTSGATITISNASPCVITWTAHGYTGCHAIDLSTTGALPSPLVANTTYYVVPSSITTNTFEIATTVANALAGTAINTSSSGSGTQSAFALAVTPVNTATNVAGLQVSAGLWLIYGQLQLNNLNSSNSAALVAGVSTTSAAFVGGTINQLNLSSAILSTMSLASGSFFLRVGSSTDVYLVAQQGSAANWYVSGSMGAVRVG